MRLYVFGHSDKGKKRRLNEDYFLCFDLSRELKDKVRPFYLLAVADGIGGHAAGEVASSLAVEILKKRILYHFKNKGPHFQPKKALMESFVKANEIVYNRACDERKLTGMGTTLVAALIIGNRAIIANVGDSRAYRIREKILEQITLDHSWKAEQIRGKTISERDIHKSPFKNMITRSLGFDSSIKVDIFGVELCDSDFLLLCTDGLYDSLSDQAMIKPFKRNKRPEKICRRLIKLADQHSGHDNITVIISLFREAEQEHLSMTDTVKLGPPPSKS